jgi:hypothetical protein
MIRVMHVDRSTLNFLNRAQGEFHVIELQRFSHQAKGLENAFCITKTTSKQSGNASV